MLVQIHGGNDTMKGSDCSYRRAQSGLSDWTTPQLVGTNWQFPENFEIGIIIMCICYTVARFTIQNPKPKPDSNYTWAPLYRPKPRPEPKQVQSELVLWIGQNMRTQRHGPAWIATKISAMEEAAYWLLRTAAASSCVKCISEVPLSLLLLFPLLGGREDPSLLEQQRGSRADKPFLATSPLLLVSLE